MNGCFQGHDHVAQVLARPTNKSSIGLWGLMTLKWFCIPKVLDLLKAPGKNKMRPTNPNADTFFEGEKAILITFSTGHSCGAPWHDTLFWQSGRTLLLDPSWPYCATLLRDTFTWYAYLTLWLDTLVGHSYLTLLWGTLTFDTFVGRSYLTLLRDTFVRRSDLTHSLDTLVVTLFLDTLVGHSYGALL